MLALRADADNYAPTLLEVAKLAFQRPLMSLSLVGIMESRSALRQRIERLLNFRAPRRAGLTVVSVLGICVFSAVAVPMGNAPDSTNLSNENLPVISDQQIAQMNLIQDAKLKYEAGKFDEAEKLLKSVLANDPTNSAANYHLNLVQAARANAPALELLTNLSEPKMVQAWHGTNGESVIVETKDGAQVSMGSFKVGTNAIPVTLKTETNLLSTSVFKLDKDKFAGILKDSNLPADNSTNIASSAKIFFGKEGINWNSPEGKNVFYNEMNGILIVRATKSDLDEIEKIAIALNESSEQSAGILTNPKFVGALQELQKRTGIDSSNLPEPTQVTTQIRGENHLDSSVRTDILQKLKTAQTNIISGRQKVIEKLNRIRLDYVRFENATLSEVARQLSASSKQKDPEHEGVNFLINSNPDSAGIDPATGFPITNSALVAKIIDLGTNVTVSLNLTNVLLSEVLYDIILLAKHPPEHNLTYSTQVYGVMFSDKGAHTPQLFTRGFKLDEKRFAGFLKDQTGLPVDNSTNLSRAARIFFSKAGGVDWQSPAGKSVFYNDKNGVLIVRTTEKELDTITQILSGMMNFDPQVHIKARFVKVPKDTVAALGIFPNLTNSAATNFTDILNATNAKFVLKSLASIKGAEILAEPEVVTSSGRQAQIHVTQTITVVSNFVFESGVSNQYGAITPQTVQVETGTILDVIPCILADGYTLNLTVIPSLIGFEGYDTPPNIPNLTATNNSVQLPVVLPRFNTQKVVAIFNLWDGQTAVIGGMKATNFVTDKVPVVGSVPLVGKLFQSKKTTEEEIFVFVTATLVDPADNRIHSADQLPFAQSQIPPQ